MDDILQDTGTILSIAGGVISLLLICVGTLWVMIMRHIRDQLNVQQRQIEDLHASIDERNRRTEEDHFELFETMAEIVGRERAAQESRVEIIAQLARIEQRQWEEKDGRESA